MVRREEQEMDLSIAAWMSGMGGGLADAGMGSPAPCRVLERGMHEVQPATTAWAR